jgi:hypothetical protein
MFYIADDKTKHYGSKHSLNLRTPHVGYPRLFIQYILRHPSYLEDISSIRNLRARHAVVARDPLNLA